MTIRAQVDGSDDLKITAAEAVWRHKAFRYPRNVSLNGIHWSPRAQPVLPNAGSTAFLPPGVDFSTARIVGRKGRDVATLWADKEAVWVHFADNPDGSWFLRTGCRFRAVAAAQQVRPFFAKRSCLQILTEASRENGGSGNHLCFLRFLLFKSGCMQVLGTKETKGILLDPT